MPRLSSGPVGVFDSGVGGISVLKELVKALPHEDYVFFGDSANAPYGEKPSDWIERRCSQITALLLGKGSKAIVVACNTATSAAVEVLRDRFAPVPIIGIEPALKPAAASANAERILVMATPNTLKLDKYQKLADDWAAGKTIVNAPCAGLAARIEQGDLDSPDLVNLIESLVGSYRGNVDAVVLGCTHYPFVERQIRTVIGDVPFFDGAAGTARQLERKLAAAGLLNESCQPGTVEFLTSDDRPGELDLYRSFFAADFD